jgi:hypothetical protein
VLHKSGNKELEHNSSTPYERFSNSHVLPVGRGVTPTKSNLITNCAHQTTRKKGRSKGYLLAPSSTASAAGTDISIRSALLHPPQADARGKGRQAGGRRPLTAVVAHQVGRWRVLQRVSAGLEPGPYPLAYQVGPRAKPRDTNIHELQVGSRTPGHRTGMDMVE